MKKAKTVIAALLTLWLATPALADTVYLFDGASHQGIITKQDENSVVIKTSAGEFTFQRGRVARISFDDNAPAQEKPVQRPKRRTYRSAKDPNLACCLSCLIPGVGQFYNGDTSGGIMCLGTSCLISCVSYLGAMGYASTASNTGDIIGTAFAFYTLGAIAQTGLSLYSAFEAHNAATQLNRRVAEDASLSQALLAEGIR